MKFLGELLKRNQILEILDLNSNRIEDDGAIYLSEALALYNRTLQALVYIKLPKRDCRCNYWKIRKCDTAVYELVL